MTPDRPVAADRLPDPEAHDGAEHVCGPSCQCGCPEGLTIPVRPVSAAVSPAEPPTQSDIDGGRAPARTMRQIASAVRQDTAGAGARYSSLKLILDGGSIHGPVALSDDVKAALGKALDGLIGHLERIEKKLALAIAEEEPRGR